MYDLFLDAMSQLSRANGAVERWDASKKIATKLGFDALNVGSWDLSSGEMNWALSSMRQDWLDDYTDQQMFLVDPLVKQLQTQEDCKVLQAGTLFRSNTESQLLVELNQQLDAMGYRSLFSFSVPGQRENESRVVVFGGGQDPLEYKRAIGLNKMRLVATAIGTMLNASEETLREDGLFIDQQRLSDREIEVLKLLATGNRNLVIAERLNISEVTVRMHVTSARKKLGARTREHALAKATKRGFLSL